MLCKASGKSKLGKGKKRSCLGSIIYGFKGGSKGKPIKHKKLDNNETKLGKYNKWP